jgi:creatinine deaminase
MTAGVVGVVGQLYSTDAEKLQVAAAEAALGASEGGIPIGAALFSADGTLLGSGHNRRVQDDDAAMHAETNAFHNAGRQRSYRDTVMVTTLSPCWYCSGLVRQFGIGRVVVGDDQTFLGGQYWLAENGVHVTVINDPELIAMMGAFTAEHPALWNEDIGED